LQSDKIEVVLLRVALIVSWLLCAHVGVAQTVNLSDSLRHVFQQKAVVTAKLDSRNSFVSGRGARVHGVKAGVSFGKRLSLGLGYNWIKQGVVSQEVKVDGRVYDADVNLRYIAPFVEYSFYKKGNWEATVPVQIGFGRSFLQYNNGYQNERMFQQGVMLYEPGMTLEYKILNLVGVGAGLGYRIMLKNNRDIDHSFTSPMYVIRFRLIFDEIYKQAKTWHDKK
jgi:hypothetical protein